MKVLLTILSLMALCPAAFADQGALSVSPEKDLTRIQPMREGLLAIEEKSDLLWRVAGTVVSGPISHSEAQEAEDAGAPLDVALRPKARSVTLPRTRWQHRPRHVLWTRGALSALKSHGAPLVNMVPADIETWCPAYEQNGPQQRRAFWVGFLSALAKYESTYKAQAVGGGGKWYGLLQILPGTARGYGCSARSGQALKNGAANLSCAIRIMAVTVPRDGVIYGRGGKGVAADWGPMRSKRKRADMAAWLRRQSYCTQVGDVRPRGRPGP